MCVFVMAGICNILRSGLNESMGQTAISRGVQVFITFNMTSYVTVRDFDYVA